MNRKITFLIFILSLLAYSADISAQSGTSCQTAIQAVSGNGNTYTSTGPAAIWYHYTPATNCRLEITTPGYYNYPSYITTFADCDAGDSIEEFHNTVEYENYFYASQGITYYFQWRNPNGGQAVTFPFTITEAVPSQGEICSNPFTFNASGTLPVSTLYPTWYEYTNNTSRIQEIKVGNPAGIYCQARFDCGQNDYERSVKHFFLANGTAIGVQFEAQIGDSYFVKVYPGNVSTVNATVSLPLQGQSCDNAFSAIIGSNAANHTQSTDQWYKIKPSQPGVISLSCSTIANWNDTIQVRWYKGCGTTAFLIGSDSLEVDATDTTYICLRAGAFISPVYNFNLAFRPIAAGSDITSAIPVPSPGNYTAPAGTGNLWYKYTSPVNATVTVSTCGTNSVGTGVNLYQLYDLEKFYLGANYGSGCVSGQAEYTLLVGAGQTIYIDWSSNSNQLSNWTLTATPTGQPLPAGYGYDAAINIPLGSGSGTGNYPTSTAVQTNQTWVWYKFHNTSGDTGILTVSNCSTNPAYPTKVYIAEDSTFAAGTIWSESSACGSNSQSAAYTLVPDQTVYVVWWLDDPTAGNFNWNLNWTSNFALPAGTTCSNPLTAVLGQNSANTAGGNQVFTYTPTEKGHLQISSAVPVEVTVYNNCGDYTTYNYETGLNYPLISNANNVADSIGFWVSAGNSYVIVWSQGYTSAPFNWNIAFSPVSSNAKITGFTIPNQIGASSFTSDSIKIVMPYNTNLADLIPSFVATGSVSVNSVVQTSGTTTANFTTPLTYVVTAEDSVTTKTYYVKVTAPDTAAEITAFTVPGQIRSSKIVSGVTGTVSAQITIGAPLTSLAPTFTLSPGATATVASVTQVSGVTANDYTTAVTYVVTSQNKEVTKNWVVTVSNADTAAVITSFTIPGQVGNTVIIPGATGSIAVQMPYNSSLASLTPSFTLSPNATVTVAGINQVSGTTSNDFATPLTYAVKAQSGTIVDWTVTVTAPDTSAEITAFSIPTEIGNAVITTGASGKVTVQLPYQAVVTSLIPTFTLSAGATATVASVAQVSGTTANNFTTAVTYVVVAQNGIKSKNWTVYVTTPNTAADITDFTVPGQTGSSVITPGTPGTVALNVPFGTDVTALVPDFTLSAGATAKVGAVKQVSDTTSDDFTSPVTYVVTAQDGVTTMNWKVTVNILPDTATLFTAFTIPKQDGVAEINSEKATVLVSVRFGTPLTSIIPTFTLSPGATATVGTTAQVSGTTANNFTSSVVYTVTAQDTKTTEHWTVTVATLPDTAALFTAFSVPGEVGSAVIDDADTTVTVSVPAGTKVTALVPTFTLSPGATATVGTTAQVSGTTANNFTNPVTYKLTPQDGTPVRTWKVTVTYLSTESGITSFTVPQEVDKTTIDTVTHTVTLYVLPGTSRTSLVPSFTLSTGASATVGGVAQTSGVTANNFTNAVTYKVTAQDGTNTTDWTVTISYNTGILAAKGENINVYPVPASDFVNINIPEGSDGEWTISISNMNGQVVYSDKLTLNAGVTKIDLSNTNSGIYNLVMTKSDQSVVKKLIIAK